MGGEAWVGGPRPPPPRRRQRLRASCCAWRLLRVMPPAAPLCAAATAGAAQAARSSLPNGGHAAPRACTLPAPPAPSAMPSSYAGRNSSMPGSAGGLASLASWRSLAKRCAASHRLPTTAAGLCSSCSTCEGCGGCRAPPSSSTAAAHARERSRAHTRSPRLSAAFYAPPLPPTSPAARHGRLFRAVRRGARGVQVLQGGGVVRVLLGQDCEDRQPRHQHQCVRGAR